MIDMTLEIAETAVRGAQARARELRIPITVSVVDESGRLVLCARGDGAHFLTPDTSRGKAIAAAAFRRSTKEMAETAQEHVVFWSTLASLASGDILLSPGGVPITVGGRVIGAVGCGGATGEQDHQCALAGAAAI